MQTLPIIERPAWLPASAWPWPTYALETDTGASRVTDIGQGPTLLFVHVGTWSFVWRDVIARLQNDFRCVSLDAPGSGLSDRSESAATLSHAAEAVTAVVDTLQLNDITLAAHDLGGPAGFLTASRRADRFAALVSVNCFAWRPSGPAFRGMLTLMGSAPARASDAKLGWLPRLTSTDVRRRPSLEPSRPGGIPRRHRPGGAARVAPLLPRRPRRRRPLRGARHRAARPTGRSASADDLRSVQRPAAVPAAMEGAEPQRAPGKGAARQPLPDVRQPRARGFRPHGLRSPARPPMTPTEGSVPRV